MISQPAVQPTGAFTAYCSVPVQPEGKWGVWARFKVAFRDGFIPFLQSWHPDYVPPGVQPGTGPAFTFGSPDGQDSRFFQGAGLAARLVSPYTVLPAEVSTMLQGFITLCAAARLRDLFGVLGATTESAPEQNRADSPVDGLPTTGKDRQKKTPQQTLQRTSPPATARTGPLPKAALALGALYGLTAAGAQVITQEEMSTSAPGETAGPTTEPRAISAASRFFCNNGQNISTSNQCNGKDDCGDNSDENCTQADCDNLDRAFLCDNKKCIYRYWQCDGENDCGDNSDENCTQHDCDNLGGVFLCDNKCIYTNWLCDGENDCGDNSDENCTQAKCDDLGRTFLCDNKKCIDTKLQCNGENDCGDNSDENCTQAECDDLGRPFHCDNSTCIHTFWQCDGKVHCHDGSDEQCTQSNCSDLQRPFLCKNNACIFAAWQCDGENDCGDNSDERAELCNPSSSSPTTPTVTATPESVTEMVTTVANNTMNFSGLPGATTALPANVAPLAATLSTSALAGIALGASAFLLVAGVCIYCHRRSSPAAADVLLELVTVNTAGQTQKARTQPTIQAVRKEAR